LKLQNLALTFLQKRRQFEQYTDAITCFKPAFKLKMANNNVSVQKLTATAISPVFPNLFKFGKHSIEYCVSNYLLLEFQRRHY